MEAIQGSGDVQAETTPACFTIGLGVGALFSANFANLYIKRLVKLALLYIKRSAYMEDNLINVLSINERCFY